MWPGWASRYIVRSLGTQFCFPESSVLIDVSRYEVEENIRNRGKTKLIGFPRNQTL